MRYILLIGLLVLCGCSEMTPQQQRAAINECKKYHLTYVIWDSWRFGVHDIACQPDYKS